YFAITTTPGSYHLSLHDALPIWGLPSARGPRFFLRRQLELHLQPLPYRSLWLRPQTRFVFPVCPVAPALCPRPYKLSWPSARPRSEEHTSELQSRENLVCRLLLE